METTTIKRDRVVQQAQNPVHRRLVAVTSGHYFNDDTSCPVMGLAAWYSLSSDSKSAFAPKMKTYKTHVLIKFITGQK